MRDDHQVKLRSLIFHALSAAILGLGSTVAMADEIVKPGDTVTLELPIENEAPSTTTAQNVRVVATFEEVSPPSLAGFLSIDEQGSTLGPLDIEIGVEKAQTFKVKVAIAANADSEGTFKVRLHPTVENADLFLSPDPDDLDTSVNNNIADPHFLVGDEKLIFSDWLTRNGRNPAFSGIHYSETHARSITATGHPAGGQA